MSKILVVEDEVDLLNGLTANLKKEGYQVLKAPEGPLAVQLAIREKPDLVLLDLMIPGMSGLDVCRQLRLKGSEAAIIILTARSDEIDRVLGLELGADDYVTKPFSLRELLARIRIRIRRRRQVRNQRLKRYRFGKVEINFQNFRAAKNGSELDLTPREFDILKLLIASRGSVVSRDQLLSEVWGYEGSPNTRTVDNHIVKLRRKIEDDPTHPLYILSIYGEGYKFVH